MTHHLLPRIIIACMFGAAVMNSGCGESPSSPTPTSTPSTPAPASAPPSVMAIRSMTPSAGPTIGGDYIRINGDRFESGAAVMVDGIVATVMKFTPTMITALTPPHAFGVVDVSVMNPDGQTVTLGGAYTYASFAISATPSDVTVGGELWVSFEAPKGRDCSGGGDWIAVYRVGDPDDTGAANGHSDLWYEHLCGATSGAFVLKAPDQPGHYEFRYMVGGTSVARSNPIFVRAP